MKGTIGVVTSSRADYSHLYWPLHDLARHADVDLKLIVLGAHLSPQFGETVNEIEKDGFPIAARLECLLSSDSDVGMAKTLGLASLSPPDTLGKMGPAPPPPTPTPGPPQPPLRPRPGQGPPPPPPQPRRYPGANASRPPPPHRRPLRDA